MWIDKRLGRGIADSAARYPLREARLTTQLRPYLAIPEPPRKTPLLGHLPEWVGYQNATRVLDRMLRYAEVCGPLSRVTLGPARLLVIADAELAAAALSDPRANYKGASYVLTRAVLDNVLLLNGDAWAAHRRLYRAALKNVEALPSAREATQRAVDEWLATPGERSLDIDVFSLVGDIAADFIAGLRITPSFEPHRARVQYELAGIGIDLLCQPWTFASPRRWMAMRRSVREARAFFRGAVEARLADPDPRRKDVLNGFIALCETGAYPRAVDALTEGVVNFFFTAHDVLASSTTWTLHLLASNPAWQRRLRDALEGPDAALAEAELERVVKEGLRLFPGYGLFGRTVQEEMELGGYIVPKRTLLIVSPYVTHRMERYWPDASRFDPDRFKSRVPGPPLPTARAQYLPFGSGARACLASHLAFPIVMEVVREVITRCQLEAHGPPPEVRYWGTAYPREEMRVTIHRGGTAAPSADVRARV